MHTGDLCLIQPQVNHALDVSDESVIIDVLIRRSTFRHYFYSILQGDNLLANFFMSTLYSRQGIDYLIFRHAVFGFAGVVHDLYALARRAELKDPAGIKPA